MILKTGDRWVDKFKDKKGRFVILEKAGRVAKDTIRAMAIYKGRDYGEKS